MSIESLQVRLNMIQMQLKWLEREVASLRAELARTAPPSNPLRTFSQLRGVWAGIIINDEDFQAARLKLPEGL